MRQVGCARYKTAVGGPFLRAQVVAPLGGRKPSGYQKLHDAIEKRAIDEMKHAEKLIERILFLEGMPIVSNLREIHIGSDVKAHHENDRKAEEDAIKAYNEDIRFAAEVGDNGTRESLESILEDEESHLDWIEAQLDQIGQMGIENYLAEQLG